ncbi:NlpC/P60 family protein [Fodinisporobacter ferrooxydans]|uniref:NlpC/P60 family protein n=1 Tax=Fodinisporobacter ferrooxydans TaxID=2901836 RepID=A0ABY4CP75_9BACL|nr:NlpC/P60 family protein [Alicyclobacillaceae bacterium MYW30-H2]
MLKKSKLLAFGTPMAVVMAASIASPAFANSDMPQYIATNTGWVSYHRQPSVSSPVVGRLELGEKAPLVKKVNNWWYDIRVGGKDVYITTNPKYSKVVSGSVSPALTTNPVVQQAQPPATQPSQQSLTLTQQQQKVLEIAKSQIGVKWVYGKQIPGVAFDCSNFTSWVYKTAVGIKFSSSSRQQRYDTNIGRQVILDPNDKFKNLQVGDLLFFTNPADPGDGSINQSTSGGGGHLGMYAGEINGKHYIIQEGGGRGKVTYEPMEGTWFAKNLVYAKQILN